MFILLQCLNLPRDEGVTSTESIAILDITYRFMTTFTVRYLLFFVNAHTRHSWCHPHLEQAALTTSRLLIPEPWWCVDSSLQRWVSDVFITQRYGDHDSSICLRLGRRYSCCLHAGVHKLRVLTAQRHGKYQPEFDLIFWTDVVQYRTEVYFNWNRECHWKPLQCLLVPDISVW